MHDDDFLYTLQSTCQAALHHGNKITVFTNGPAFYPAMIEAIRSVVTFTTSGGEDGSFTVKFPGEPLWENPDPEFKDLVNGTFGSKVTRPGGDVYVDRFLNLDYPSYPYGANMNQVNPMTVNDASGDTSRGLTTGWDKYGPENTGLPERRTPRELPACRREMPLPAGGWCRRTGWFPEAQYRFVNADCPI